MCLNIIDSYFRYNFRLIRTINICILLAYQVLQIRILITLTSCQEEELGFEIHCSPHGV